MKIGIINHWMVNNYGAVLLAYALEKKLLSMGYNAETISWLPDEVRYPWAFSYLKKVGMRHYFLRLGYFMVFILPRQRKMRSFRRLFANSQKEYRDKTIADVKDIYDIFVIGGDQLWNYKKEYFCIYNFLPFIEEKYRKVAYAASLSQDFMREGFAEEFRSLVEGFGYVTTREERGREIIENFCDIKAPRVTDSAFLLDAKEWRDLSRRPKDTGYVFVYQVQSDVELIEFAQSLAKEKNLKIIFCPFPLKKQIRCIRKPYPSVEEWLGFMECADYVVTDAFHGIVFSLIFNREFYCEISEYGKDTGSRITNILEIYDLRERLINGREYAQSIKAAKIDWQKVNGIINKEQAEAEKHIVSMLNTVPNVCSKEGGTDIPE